MSNGADRADQMVQSLRKWQGIERQAMEQTAQIMEQTDNPFLRVIMELIPGRLLDEERLCPDQ